MKKATLFFVAAALFTFFVASPIFASSGFEITNDGEMITITVKSTDGEKLSSLENHGCRASADEDEEEPAVENFQTLHGPVTSLFGKNRNEINVDNSNRNTNENTNSNSNIGGNATVSSSGNSKITLPQFMELLHESNGIIYSVDLSNQARLEMMQLP